MLLTAHERPDSSEQVILNVKLVVFCLKIELLCSPRLVARVLDQWLLLLVFEGLQINLLAFCNSYTSEFVRQVVLPLFVATGGTKKLHKGFDFVCENRHPKE